MPTVVIRLQNSTRNAINYVDQSGNNVTWNQDPPASVGAGASSGNFQIAYDEPADFSMRYSIAGQEVPFTAAALLEDHTLDPSGGAPGAYSISFVTTGAYPNFAILFTFNPPPTS